MSDLYFDWARVEEKTLAKFVSPDDLPNEFRWPTDVNRLDLIRSQGPEAVVERLYDRLRSLAIQYDLSPLTPGTKGRQLIRKPQTILRDRQATCLDLAVLFASMCLRCDVLPLIVLLQGHALMGFSRRRTPRTATVEVWPGGGTNNLRSVLEAAGEDYILLECTGAARSKSLAEEFPEGCGRGTDGTMSFRRACEAGLKQISKHAVTDSTNLVPTQRAFLCALDVYSLQHHHGLQPNTSDASSIGRSGLSLPVPPEADRLLTTAEVKAVREQFLGWVFARCNRLQPVPITPRDPTSRRVLHLRLSQTFTWMEALGFASALPRRGTNRVPSEDEDLDYDDEGYDAVDDSDTPGTWRNLSGHAQDPAKAVLRPEKLPIPTLVGLHRHLLLLGEPGYGKSTALKYIALCMAGEELGSQEANLDTLVADVSELHVPQARALAQNALRGLLPIRVSLSELADRGLPPLDHSATSEDLWRFIHSELEEGLARDFSLLRTDITTKGGILLLDGLDEFPGARDYQRQLLEMVEDFAARHPKCRIVITSRPNEYRANQWSFPGFSIARLQPFDDTQRHTVAARWFSASGLEPEAFDSVTFLNGFQDVILSESRLWDLSRIPLFLWLMLQIYASGGLHAGGHVDLLERVVELLLVEWEIQKLDHKTGAREGILQILNTDRVQLRRTLNELALDVHRGFDRRGGSTTSISEKELLSVFFGMSRRHGKNVTDELMRLIGERAGLLEEHRPGQYRFLHRQIQEYLAACALAAAIDYPANLLPLIHQNAANLWETFLLVNSIQIQQQPASLWVLIDTLCPRDIAAAIDEAIAWRVFIAGNAYMKGTETLDRMPSLGEDVTERLQRWLLRVMREPIVSADIRGMSGQLLGIVGDPRPQVLSISEMRFCFIPAGSYQAEPTRGKWKPVTIAYDYWLAEYPVTQAQMEGFFQAFPSTRPSPYSMVDFAPNLPYAAHHSWPVAKAFCDWMQQEYARYLPVGYMYCLPSESEWAMAARGGGVIPREGEAHIRPLNRLENPEWELIPNPIPRRAYPWGDEAHAYERCNCNEISIGITCPGCFPTGVSPYGCQDMLGNVEQWTRDIYKPHGRWKPRFDTTIGRIPEERVVVGGGLEDLVHIEISAHAARSSESLGSDWMTWAVGLRVAICPIHSANLSPKAEKAKRH